MHQVDEVLLRESWSSLRYGQYEGIVIIRFYLNACGLRRFFIGRNWLTCMEEALVFQAPRPYWDHAVENTWIPLVLLAVGAQVLLRFAPCRFLALRRLHPVVVRMVNSVFLIRQSFCKIFAHS